MIPVDEADRRKALYTGMAEIFCVKMISGFKNPAGCYNSFFFFLFYLSELLAWFVKQGVCKRALNFRDS